MHHRSIDSNASRIYLACVNNGDTHREASSMSRKDPQFNLRLPEELKQWIESQAQANCRSQTAELVYRLREAKRQQEQAIA
ncbi:Arc family DNA-binding protein [Pseudomonas helleri]|uniref:Arc family DNA-binding protein n=1 Tax=Pseudomonas helleri TaxID=1608996 RepID=UPI003FD19DFE